MDSCAFDADSNKIQKLTAFIDLIQVPKIKNPGFSTKAIHTSYDPKVNQGSLCTPIFMSSAFAMKTNTEGYSEYGYAREGNPTASAFEKTMAVLEKGKYARTYSTGAMAAFASFGLVKTGGHILCSINCYTGTKLEGEKYLGPHANIEMEPIVLEDIEVVKKSIRPETEMIFIESPSNPKLSIVNVEEIVSLAKENNIITVYDNTILTPYLFNPLDHGVDIVMHSYAKFIGGHSDLMGGVLVLNDEKMYKTLSMQRSILGSLASPFNDYLGLRSIKSLTMRMDVCCANAFIIAHWLENHKNVNRVYYPGLESHPGHQYIKQNMKGYGALLSFEIDGDQKTAEQVVNKIKMMPIAGGNGGIESLISMCKFMTHKVFSPEERYKEGIKDTLIRISVGCEDIIDILIDLDQALNY